MMIVRNPEVDAIRRISIVDDEESTRNTWRSPIEESDREPIVQDQPLPQTLEASVDLLQGKSDAVLCDHHLMKKRRYARFNGASVVAACYRRRFPAILCTHYQESIDEIRPFREHIPVLLSPAQLSPDELAHGLEICIQEFRGSFTTRRRPHPAQLRVEDIVGEEDKPEALHLIVNGWSPHQVVKVGFSDIPEPVRQAFLLEHPKYLYAWVNIAAESAHELYFTKWTAS